MYIRVYGNCVLLQCTSIIGHLPTRGVTVHSGNTAIFTKQHLSNLSPYYRNYQVHTYTTYMYVFRICTNTHAHSHHVIYTSCMSIYVCTIANNCFTHCMFTFDYFSVAPFWLDSQLSGANLMPRYFSRKR